MATPLVTEAAPGVFGIRLGWSNAYVLDGGSGFALIDSGTPWDAGLLGHALEMFGGPGRCELVLLTHAHPDHAGLAASVAARSGAPVVAHHEERPFLESGQLYGAQAWQSAVFGLGSRLWPVRPCRLGRALSDGDLVETPAGSWRAVHTPGHTRGHTSFWRDDGVLLSGDAVLNILPWTRRPGLSLPQRLFTEDVATARESVRRLAELRPRLLLAGHGAPLSEAAEPLHRFAFG